MAKKSKRGSGPRPGSNRAERVAARKARQAAAMAPTPRPFSGLAAECDLVALRSFVASATARLDVPVTAPGDNEIQVVTVLPGAIAALTREAGDTAQGPSAGSSGVEGLVALQTDPEPEDVNAALAQALSWASQAEVGAEYPGGDAGGGVLADLLPADANLDITVYEDFSWWFPAGTDVPPEVAAMLERAEETVMPTARLRTSGDVGAPWWVDAGARAHLRWVRPESEDDLMAALARLHAAGDLTLGEGSRFAGSFRTHGLLVPVFDLDPERHHEEWHSGVDVFDAKLADALSRTGDLTAAELGSRDGIRARQVTLR